MNQQPLRAINVAILLCDMQERFRPKIAHFEHVERMAEKLLKAATKLDISILSTEQNPKALGGTVESLSKLLPAESTSHSKSQFSMLIPQINSDLSAMPSVKHVALLGIESHICILQSSLDLLSHGFQVHVLADAVSSCNVQERSFALQSIRHAGGTITTTESFIYRLLADANHPRAKDIFAIVKEYNSATRDALCALCPP